MYRSIIRAVSLSLAVLILPLVCTPFARSQDTATTKPLRALLVTGGCCHDYVTQTEIIKQGIRQRVNVTWEVFQGSMPDEREPAIYQTEDWSQPYDVVIHNECYGAVTDPKFVDRIVRGHTKHHVPAIVIHCAMHSYRNATTDAWRKLIGISSRRHESRGGPLEIVSRAADHPIMRGFENWLTPQGELYIVEKTWPNTTPLATAYGAETQTDHTVIWTNTYQGVRVFGTTLGHHNETMLTDEWLNIISKGLLWACNKLDDSGIPSSGHAGVASAPIAMPNVKLGRQGKPTIARTAAFPDSPHLIPGLVEMEHYDRGPAGEAYSDNDQVNQGVDYRADTQVDIEQRPDASNGHGVGWTRAGEWLNYTVDVARSGLYDLEIPVASNKQGGVFHLEFDGRDATGPISIPDTGSWQQLQLIHATGVQLQAGIQTMRAVMDSQGPSGSIGDIDYVHFVNARTADNTLSALEQKAGWKLLFNGVDHTGWKCNNGKDIATPVEDNCLLPYKSGGYLILHEKQYDDFVLKCDVKWEAEQCNSGIFFRVEEPNNPVHTGFELQVMSGDKVGKHHFGALYDLVPPTKNVTNPTGQWNTVEIRCQNENVLIRVNGETVTVANLDDYSEPGRCPDGTNHKFKLNGTPRAVKDFARTGYIGFQDHGQKVWYKNVKLLDLSP